MRKLGTADEYPWFGNATVRVELRDLLDEIAYDGWIYVELAYEEKTVLTRTPAENARLSREYVREVFGV